jgi:hypothetical protein
MANLDPKKMLPPSKSFLAKTKKSFIVPQSQMLGTKKINVSDVVKGSGKKQDFSDRIQEDIYEIKVKVIDIEKLLKSSFSDQKKFAERKRRTVEKDQRETKEKKLEEKPKTDLKTPQIKNFPKIGLLDTIKRFILNTVLGFFAVRLLDQLPLLMKFLTVIGRIADFVIDIGGKLLNGLVTFIDWGYKAYDATRGFLKNLFGADGVKQFDKLMGVMNKVLNLAIIAGLILGAGKFGGGKGSPGRGGGARPKPGQGGRPKVTRSGGGPAGRPDVRNPFRQRPKVTTGGGRGFGNPFRMKPKITGSGSKGIARLLGKGLGRVPIIGGLIDFAINLLMGENPGRAAARAVGSTIGASLGGIAAGAVGSIVPIAGTMVGGLIGATLGGLLGDAVGGTLYDVLVGTKQKMAEGGKVTTRAGKIVGGGTTRSLKKTKRKLEARMPDEVQLNPGESVGGDIKLKKLFPESSDTKTMSPFGVIEGTAKQFTGVNYLGPLFGVFSKVLLGQKPSSKDYENIGLGINAWITKGINSGDIKGGITAAFAEGGVVDSASLTADTDISKWVEYSSKDLLNSAVDESTKTIMQNLMLKPAEETKTTAPGEEPGAGGDMGGPMGAANDSVGGARLFMQLGFPMLAAAILSGNVQQESGWKGQRTPWVLNDGAGTNKGLISWNRSRIKNAEKFLGKPLEKASNAEQVRWIKEELKQYGLLDDFMNPKATEAQLKAASYKYIGWGDVGARWKYSSQIFAALQKGEKGTFTSGGSGGGISLGKGYGSAGSKLAGELGRYVKKLGVVPGSIHEHPEHGGVRGRHSPNSYHYQGRAIDLGAYAYEQGPVLKAIADFNRMKGIKPVELLKAGDPGHSDHVHVAYREGGFADGPQYAMLGEEGTEAITDADSTRLLGKNFFATINAIENKSQLKKHAGSLINTLNSYAGYENGAPIMVVDPGPSPASQQEDASPKPKSDPFTGESSNANAYDPFNKLYALG